MCGIAGAMGELSAFSLKRMASIMQHRGPDHLAMGSFADVHLAHARLSVIDLSTHSNQPLWDTNRRACIVFNGEIYNYKILREELIDLGYVFLSEGDAEVIVNLYLHYGTSCLTKLVGMFAFALWDSERSELFLARDTYGVKPLYYAQTKSGFYFASELKSLLVVPSIGRDLNYDALFRTLVFLWSPGPDTVLKTIVKLEPGQYLIVRDRQIVKQAIFAHWPQYEPQDMSVSHACQRIEQALLTSVTNQSVADVPVGAFLSGGLDSSLIVAMAARRGQSNIESFTIKSVGQSCNNDGFVDDLPYARQVATYLNVKLNVVDVNPQIIQLLSKMLYHLDEPHADPASFNVFLICEKAREKGIKVLFSGAGGDDIFSGYRRHNAIILEQYWSWLPMWIRSAMQSTISKLPKKNVLFRRVSKLFSYISLPINERILSYFYWINPKIVRGLFVQSIQTQLSDNPMSSLLTILDEQKEKNALEKMLDLERRYFLVDHNLNYTDKLSMASGIEVRVPFLDPDVLDVASNISVNLKHRRGHGKWILKKMAEKYLPKSVIYRSKTGFGAPLRAWLHHDLKPLIDELLNEKTLSKRGIFNPVAVRHLIDKDLSGQEDYSYTIFALLCMELWCRLFIDGEAMDIMQKFEKRSVSDVYYEPA